MGAAASTAFTVSNSPWLGGTRRGWVELKLEGRCSGLVFSGIGMLLGGHGRKRKCVPLHCHPTPSAAPHHSQVGDGPCRLENGLQRGGAHVLRLQRRNQHRHGSGCGCGAGGRGQRERRRRWNRLPTALAPPRGRGGGSGAQQRGKFTAGESRALLLLLLRMPSPTALLQSLAGCPCHSERQH